MLELPEYEGTKLTAVASLQSVDVRSSDSRLTAEVLRITPELFEIHKQRAVDARKAQAQNAGILMRL